jgi:neopullulanase
VNFEFVFLSATHRKGRGVRYAAMFALLGAVLAAEAPGTESFRARLPADEVIYFLLPDRFANGDPANDRGGLTGERLATGFDPADKGFFHGGDLAGVRARLDYIQSLGATAVWLSPVFKNKPVQGARGEESAGYHGYWVTDFTRVDPHFGSEGDLRALVDAAHARGMKVYLDIITNHTADVIAYRECPMRACAFRSKPYTPFVSRAEQRVKVPEWLNDTALYHNQGNTTWSGESVELGDFVGLDDLKTEDPRVVQGFIEVYGAWIDRFGIDGYRVDTARHVNVEFWQAFVPAMRAKAAADEIPNFHVFGEVATSQIDVPALARYTRVAGFPAVLDFAFANAVRATVAGRAGTDVLARMFAEDTLYQGGEQAALQLPTFISNHDQGRFASLVRADRPGASDAEVLKRVTLAYAMLMTLRGVPVIYYGDEQGFAGTGGDQAARQDMFATQVAEYKADRRIGVAAAGTGYDRNHPLYRTLADLARLRTSHPALRHGRQIVRDHSAKPGIFAVSRLDPTSQREVLVAFNTAQETVTATMDVAPGSRQFKALHGQCAPAPAASGRYSLTLAPLEFAICAAGE